MSNSPNGPVQHALAYEAICEASPDAIILVDMDGRVSYANDRVTDLFGYEPEELVGEPVEVLVPESAREGHVEQREGYMADPETRPMGVTLDLHARRADGSTFPVDIGLSPLVFDGDRYVMATVRDISQRETLRTRYRAILEAVPDAVVVADEATGEILEANERTADLLGCDLDGLVGRPQTAMHPSSEEARYRRLFERHTTTGTGIRTQHPDGSDIEVETADGERLPVEINAHVFERGDRRLVVGVFRDVTGRRERERQLKSLHEATRDLVTAESRERIAQRVAEAANTILDHPSTVVRFVEEGVLRPVAVTEQAQADLGARPDYPLTGDSPAVRAFEGGEPLWYSDTSEFDGHDLGETQSVAYLPIGAHGVISIVSPEANAFDRSDVEFASILAGNAEVALDRRDYQRKLERQTERLEEFASIVSHDLRNPLNVAQGNLELAREAETDAEAASDRDHLRVARDALERMEAIIEDTLTLARRGRVVDDDELVSVAGVATDCWRMVETADADLELVEEFAVRGDRNRLRHLFENLFRNAVEHGGGGVTVRVGTLEADGFYVEDDGPGIPEKRRATVFEPGRTGAEGGTGLGLTIVERIAEAHGWSVRLECAESGGARFEFDGVDVA